MAKHDDKAMEERRVRIYAEGASAAECSVPKELGSMERCTWYDGYASTHPEFKNPYRRTQRAQK